MASERRRAPRFNKLLWLDIAGLEVRTSNVSETGLQLVLTAEWWQRMERRLMGDRFAARVTLPGGLAVDAQCRVVYVSECDDECLIGVHIVHMSAADQALWVEFVSSGARVPRAPAAAFAPS